MNVTDETGVEDRRAEGVFQPLHLGERRLDRFQLQIGQAPGAKRGVVDAGRAGQGPSPQKMTLGGLDIAAGRRDRLGQRGPEASRHVSVAGFEQIRGGQGRQAQPQARLGVVEEQAG